MTTMLDKCAVAGDITQGIDRRGVWTAAITVIGGTSNTAVKLVSSDTVNGVYTDYKTLISAADAGTDQYKGFVVDLHGAKKYIKVTGATMATAVFGDCDHDVKNIAITAGEVPSGADLEDNKTVSITENGVVEITPSEGKDGMKKVTATVNVPVKEEQTKSVTITTNGTTTITPDSGKVLSSVEVTADVETPKADKYFLWSYSASPTNWTNVANTWASMCSNAGKTPLTGYTGTAFPSFLYIKGKDDTSNFAIDEQITIYSSQDASNYATVTVLHKDVNYIIVTNPKAGASESDKIYLSRTKTAEISTFLTTFARFDGITKLPTFEAIYVTGNAVVLPPNTADGIGYASIDVPPVVTEPSKIITETFTPELNTPHQFATSSGPGGSYGLSGSGSFTNLIKASDISGGTVTTARITWGPGASQGYYVDFSLTISGSGYPQTLTITPTDIGSAWGARTVSVCLII